MKTATPALISFLNTSRQICMARLYTITLSGGQILRWTDADLDVTFSGVTWVRGPLISDGGVKMSRGMQTDGVDLRLIADERHTINGVPLVQFVLKNGFDGATFLLERAYTSDWSKPIVGVLHRFKGRFSEIREATGMEVTVAVGSWLELLDAQIPSAIYQASCLHTLYDAGCGLSKAAYGQAGAVLAGSSTTSVLTNIALATGRFDLGTITFSSGVASGLSRTIKTQVGGALTLVLPLPVAPSAGDTFTAYPGCDLSKTTCSAKFGNLLRHRGFPLIPVAETAV